MPSPKPLITAPFPSISSASDALLANKAIPLFKFHPDRLHHLASQFTPQTASVLLLKCQFDRNLSRNIFRWARGQPFFDLRCKCLTLHVLARFNLRKYAQTLCEDLAVSEEDASGLYVFECLKDSLHACNSTPAVFDLLVKSFSRLKMIDKAVNIINLAKYNGFAPGILSYNSLLAAIGKSSGSVDLAEQLYREMTRSGISPNTYSYNILIRCLCAERTLEDGLAIFTEMEKRRCLPTVVTFNTLMDAYCKLGRIKEAFELLNSMPSRGIEPDFISYNVILNGLCRKGFMKEATGVLEKMNQKGFRANEVTYTTLVNGYCRAGIFDHGLSLLADMVRNGVLPNVVTYTALINCMCKARNMKQAMTLLDHMRGGGLCPNERTYTTLIDGFCQQGSLKEAYRVLSEMIESGFSPSIVAYNALVKGHCILGEINVALQIVDDTVKKGLKPNLVTYSTLISDFCRRGDTERAFQVMRDMIGNGVSPDAVTYKLLIHGLVGLGRLADACDLFREMLRMDLSPDEVSYTLLVHGLCKDGDIERAILLHEETIQKGFLSDVCYRVLVTQLWRHACTREARQLLFSLFYNNHVPDDIAYDILTESCGKIEHGSMVALVKELSMKGLMDEADLVFESMSRRDNMPSKVVYNVIIHGHCKFGMVGRAHELYREMVWKGFVPHALSVIALVKALCKVGMSEELNEVVSSFLRRCRLMDCDAKAFLEIREGKKEDAVVSLLTKMARDWFLPSDEKRLCS